MSTEPLTETDLRAIQTKWHDWRTCNVLPAMLSDLDTVIAEVRRLKAEEARLNSALSILHGQSGSDGQNLIEAIWRGESDFDAFRI